MDHRAEAWYRRRTSQWADWPLADLLAGKQRAGIRISVVIPARNEERTVAGVVGPLARALMSDAQLVDELVVIDSDSADATGEVAAQAGATVHRARESLPIPVGYGVELSTLLDTASRHGLNALAQVDLGSRAHRHQADRDLAVMAAELLAVAQRRRPGADLPVRELALEQYQREDGQVRRRSRPVPTYERPPANSVPAARSPEPLRAAT